MSKVDRSRQLDLLAVLHAPVRELASSARHTRLPLLRVWMRGRSRRYLTWSVDEEVRERVLDELRPGVVAQWSDPLERLGIRPRMAKRRHYV
jgi:hypothetical protein